MIFAHVMGVPVEESALALAPAGAAILTGAAVVVRSKLAEIGGAATAPLRRRGQSTKRREAMRIPATAATVRHRTVEVDGLDIFYREAGDEADPTVLLLHGFPTSSFMFRNLIPALSDEFHLVAPDYPSFGQSSFPPKDEFDYTFERFYEIVLGFVDALGLDTFSIYVQDYGAPIGLRIASRHPERVQALIVQNGNAYMDGFTPMWEPLFAYAGNRNSETEAPVRGLLDPETIKWLWTHGTRDPESIAPETWMLDALNLDRRDNREIQLDIFYDYRLNIPEYEKFQQYLREHRPPTLITWGKGDEIFGPAGAEAYARDLPDAELHLLDTGHFALEEELEFIADKMRRFLNENVRNAPLDASI
jgi:pimeloyl-ACP methyl ester carboxylesterase